MNINDVCVSDWLWWYWYCVNMYPSHVFAAFDSLPRQMYGFIDSSENESRAMLYGHWQVMRIMRKIAVDDRDHVSLFMSRCFFLCMSTSYIVFGGQIINETESNMIFTTCLFISSMSRFLLFYKHTPFCHIFSSKRPNVTFPINKKQQHPSSIMTFHRCLRMLLPSLALLWIWRLGGAKWCCEMLFQQILKPPGNDHRSHQAGKGRENHL